MIELASEKETTKLTEEVDVLLAEGDPNVIEGPKLSTVNVVLGPADGDKFPTLSDEVPLAIEMPKLPLPVILEIVTVLLVVPDPEIDMVPFAVPVLFNVTFDELKVIKVASV